MLSIHALFRCVRWIGANPAALVKQNDDDDDVVVMMSDETTMDDGEIER